MNKSELIDQVAGAAGISKSQASDAVDALFGADSVIAKAMKGGNKVQITGFGTFVARDRAARVGRDPRTGNPVQIKAAKVPSFKAGQGLKNSLNS
ncbi:MAG: HU family DNA-binding protein [Gemmatimonadetes bacterium]|nr:HU family DNA-binding protein [Gemmatimonadota bacterium]MCZ6761092.1 HU family DNA-binding protein [Gemmatimonadota bacterium]